MWACVDAALSAEGRDEHRVGPTPGTSFSKELRRRRHESVATGSTARLLFSISRGVGRTCHSGLHRNCTAGSRRIATRPACGFGRWDLPNGTAMVVAFAVVLVSALPEGGCNARRDAPGADGRHCSGSFQLGLIEWLCGRWDRRAACRPPVLRPSELTGLYRSASYARRGRPTRRPPRREAQTRSFEARRSANAMRARRER